MARRLSLVHVSPFPLEATDNAVNAYISGVCGELSQRGHYVLILAPSRSSERARASRRALRAARSAPRTLIEAANEGAPNVIAIGEAFELPGGGHGRLRPPPALPLDVARTIEETLSLLAVDVVHVHEPFAPSASNVALRCSSSLNVATFHHPTERLLSTLIARKLVQTLFGRLDARTATNEETASLLKHYFPERYTLVDRGPSPIAAEASPRARRRARAGQAATGDPETGKREPPSPAPGAWSRAADDIEAVYDEVLGRRHPDHGDVKLARKLAGKRLIDVDLHMHTDHSSDCETPVEVLLSTARERGLGAIAVTDHNEISGALQAAALAQEMGVKVIVGEEVKTASEGEVIGLFIKERIRKGLTLPHTIAEIKRQGGIVYVPHPFDRLHSVPDYRHLLPILDDVDAIEVFNPRVAINAFNEEAAKFAAKYRLIAGAGSDSHVVQGLGSVRIRMRDFDGPQEFLQSLRDADILTKPTSLLYVQALKFLQTKATPASARRASRARRVRKATQAHER